MAGDAQTEETRGAARVTSTRLGGLAASPGGGAQAERLPAVAQLAPAGAVELLDTLADSAAVLGRSEATLAEALERLTEGPVRAAVAYVPDVSGQLVPSVSAPVGAGLAGVAPAFESWLSLVA